MGSYRYVSTLRNCILSFILVEKLRQTVWMIRGKINRTVLHCIVPLSVNS